MAAKIHFRDPVRESTIKQTPMSDPRNIGHCLHSGSNFSSAFLISHFFCCVACCFSLSTSLLLLRPKRVRCRPILLHLFIALISNCNLTLSFSTFISKTLDKTILDDLDKGTEDKDKEKLKEVLETAYSASRQPPTAAQHQAILNTTLSSSNRTSGITYIISTW